MLGIDFGTTALRAVELTTGQHPQLLRYCSAPLPVGWVVDRQVKEVPDTADLLKQMLSQHGIRTRGSTIGVAFSQVITRTFKVNRSIPEAELEEMVEMEVGRTVTYPLEECNIDFYRTSLPGAAQDDIRFVVCHRNGMQNQVSVLEAAGLEPMVADVDAYSLALLHHWIGGQQSGEASRVLLDIGHISSRLIIIQDDQISHTRELSYGGQQLLEAMQTHYQLTPEAALQTLTDGEPPAYFSEQVLVPFADSLGDEVVRALKVSHADSDTDMPKTNSLHVIGGGARLPGIDKMLERRIGFAVKCMHALPHINFARRMQWEPFLQRLPEFVLATSLALRGTQ